MDQKKPKRGFPPLIRKISSAIWRFIGRVGLATRKLLTWFVWIPLYLITIPFWYPIGWLWQQIKPQLPKAWRFIGSMGLALRQLIILLIWKPLLWLIVPLWKLLKNTVVFTWNLSRRVLAWLVDKVRRAARYVWRVTAPRRHLWLRRLRSRWVIWRAKMVLWVKRPSPPRKAETAPAVQRLSANNAPRNLRLATAFATVAVLLTVGLISLQDRQANAAPPSSETADNRFSIPQIIILTPTPLPPTPTAEPTPEQTPWPTPDVTQGGGAILFTQHVNGNSDIYLLPVGQAEAVRVTTNAAVDRNPSWSPDGSRFAFVSNRGGQWDIYIFDIRQGTLENITNDLAYDGAPTWSSDGEWLAYESYQEENLDIYLMKVSEPNNPIRLTRDPAPDYAPSWEPMNGRHIAFTSWRGGGPDIFIRSLDDPLSERIVNVTQSPDAAEDGATFAPNGRFLAYTSTSNSFNLVNGVELDANAQPVGAPQNLGQQGAFPAWSPDNEALVYVFEREGQSFLVAGSPSAWGVTPQVYAAEGKLTHPSWTAVQFTPDMVSVLQHIDGEPSGEPLFIEALAQGDDTRTAQLYELPINAPSPYLSDSVDQSFMALRERVIVEAGWDVLGRLDNLFVPLAERPLPGQPSEDWNKAGRAFDLSYQEVLGFETRIEVVPEPVGDALQWRVYIKAALQDGTQGEPLRVRPWDFRARTGDDPRYFDEGGKLRDEIPVGYYIDLTTLAQDYGWEPVAAGANWRTYFPDIRFWHFENRQGLSWDAAMQQIYTPEELELLR